MFRTPSQTDIDAAIADWLTQVQAACPEPVLGACKFAPPRNEVAGRAAALGGSLGGGWIGRRVVRTVEKSSNRSRAGGLPDSFVLVVSPQTVRAYESVVSRTGSAVGPEVATWDRAALQVLDVDRGGMKTTVRLSLPSGEEISCSAGTHDYTDQFITLLASTSTVAPPV